MSDRFIFFMLLGFGLLWFVFGGVCYYFGYHSAEHSASIAAYAREAAIAKAGASAEQAERQSWAAASASLKAGLAQDEAALRAARSALAGAKIPAHGCLIPRGAIHALNQQRRRS